MALPAYMNNNRIVQALPNQYDKSTIINCSPIELHEKKETLMPNLWKMPKGSFDKPQLLVVGQAFWFMERDEKAPMVEIPVSSVQLAESIIMDFCGSLPETNIDTAWPAMFWLPGHLTLKEAQEKFKSKFTEYEIKQKGWFKALVDKADVLWARTNGNPLAISDLARMAANELNLQKPWMADFKTMEMKNCPACGTLVMPGYAICANCKHIVDPIKAKELGITK